MKHFGKKLALKKTVIRPLARIRQSSRCTQTCTDSSAAETCPMATFVSDRS